MRAETTRSGTEMYLNVSVGFSHRYIFHAGPLWISDSRGGSTLCEAQDTHGASCQFGARAWAHPYDDQGELDGWIRWQVIDKWWKERTVIPYICSMECEKISWWSIAWHWREENLRRHRASAEMAVNTTSSSKIVNTYHTQDTKLNIASEPSRDDHGNETCRIDSGFQRLKSFSQACLGCLTWFYDDDHRNA